MVQPVKTHTITIPADVYARLHALSISQQRTPSEILAIAINLLTVALPRSAQITPKLFQLPPRRSARAPKP